MKTYNDVRSGNFVAHILTLMFSDPEFLRSFRPVVRPVFFSDVYDRLFVTTLLSYWDKYGSLPEKNLWRDYSFDWVKANAKSPDVGQAPSLKVAWDSIYAYGVVLFRNRGRVRMDPWIREKIVEFAQEHQAILVVNRIVERHRREKVLDAGEAVKLFKEVTELGIDAQDIGAEFWSSYKNIQDAIPEVIPTGIKGWDDMHGGGNPRRELVGLVAPPKTFKTGFMLNAAVNTSTLGYTVYYASGEESEGRLKMKAIAKLTGIPPSMQMANIAAIAKYIERSKKFIAGKLYIKRFQKRHFSAKNIDSWISMVGDKPDLVVVDYADLMVPNEKNERMADFLARGVVAEEIREIAIANDCAVMTANKAKVDVINKAVWDAEGIGLSGEKGFIYDALSSLSMTPEMRLAGELIVHNIYNRYGPGKETFGCRVNLPCTQLLYSDELTEKFTKVYHEEMSNQSATGGTSRGGGGRRTSQAPRQSTVFGSDDIRNLMLLSHIDTTQAQGRVIDPVKRKNFRI